MFNLRSKADKKSGAGAASDQPVVAPTEAIASTSRAARTISTSNAEAGNRASANSGPRARNAALLGRSPAQPVGNLGQRAENIAPSAGNQAPAAGNFDQRAGNSAPSAGNQAPAAGNFRARNPAPGARNQARPAEYNPPQFRYMGPLIANEAGPRDYRRQPALYPDEPIGAQIPLNPGHRGQPIMLPVYLPPMARSGYYRIRVEGPLPENHPRDRNGPDRARNQRNPGARANDRNAARAAARVNPAAGADPRASGSSAARAAARVNPAAGADPRASGSSAARAAAGVNSAAAGASPRASGSNAARAAAGVNPAAGGSPRASGSNAAREANAANVTGPEASANIIPKFEPIDSSDDDEPRPSCSNAARGSVNPAAGAGPRASCSNAARAAAGVNPAAGAGPSSSANAANVTGPEACDNIVIKVEPIDSSDDESMAYVVRSHLGNNEPNVSQPKRGRM